MSSTLRRRSTPTWCTEVPLSQGLHTACSCPSPISFITADAASASASRTSSTATPSTVFAYQQSQPPLPAQPSPLHASGHPWLRLQRPACRCPYPAPNCAVAPLARTAFRRLPPWRSSARKPPAGRRRLSAPIAVDDVANLASTFMLPSPTLPT